MEKLFFFGTENLVAQHGDGDGHKGRKDVEEAVGQVGERRDMQDERLGHTAGVPRHKHRGVGEWRNLVAEVGARNDGARRPAHAVAVGRADAHQGNADGGDGGPRTARNQQY